MSKRSPASSLVSLICTVIFLESIFYSVVAPLLPSLTQHLHLSKAAAGVAVAAYPAGTVLGTLPAAFLAARHAKTAVLLGVALVGLSSLFFGLSRGALLLDLSRLGGGVGAACCWTGGFAWVVDATPAGDRGRAIGLVLSASVVGALLGPVVGTLAQMTSRVAVFGVIAGCAAVQLAYAPRAAGSIPPVASNASATAKGALGARLLGATWLVLVGAAGVGALGVIGPVRLHAYGATAVGIGAVFVGAGAVEAVLNPWLGRLSDRRGYGTPIAIGLAAAAVLLLLFGLPRSAMLLAALVVALAISLGTLWVPAMASLSREAERVGLAQGVAFSIASLAWGTGQVAGAAGGARLAKATSDSVPMLVVGTLCGLTLLACAGAARAQRHPQLARSCPDRH